MSGALFSRVKNWIAGEKLTASDLNAEFDNILTHLIPTYIDGYSANATQMRIQTDPGESGSESLATSLSGELERLRFAINEIKGTTYWYSTATTSLAQLSAALGTNITANRISSGRTSANSSQPLFLVPDGTAATITLKGSTTPFVYSIAGIQYTISTDVTVTSLTTAPASNNTCLVNDGNLSGQAYSKLVGENGSSLTVDNMGSNISALVGSIAAFKTGSTEYFLARVESTTSLTKLMRGCFFSSADARFSRVALTDNDTITLMKLTWVYAKTDGTLAVSYTNPRYGGVTPTSPSVGDYWYDTINNKWKIYNSTSFIDATATLIGICLQDSSGTKAARSFDFFKQYSDTNTIEVIKDSTTEVRSRYIGSQISVYGTTTNWSNDFIRWNTSTDFASGDSLATNTMYYFYLTETGTPYISATAPLDMRADRRGYYHPGEAWRCVGFGRTDATGSGTWQEVESFFKIDKNTLVTTLTAAVSNLLPEPYNIQTTERTFKVDGTSAGFTQVLPPAALFKGEELVYWRADNNPANAVVLDGYGSETINGASTYSLYTQYESVKLRSDGSNWIITSHFAETPWTTAAITFTGTTSAPTKGTTTTDSFAWKRSGVNLNYLISYKHTAAGTAGSGTYLITFPSGLTADSTMAFTNGASASDGRASVIGNGRLTNSSTALGNTSEQAQAFLYDTTHLAFAGLQNASGADGRIWVIWSSSSAVDFSATHMTLYITGTIPMANWNP